MSRQSTCVDVIKGNNLQLEISENEGEVNRTEYGVKWKDIREYPGTTKMPVNCRKISENHKMLEYVYIFITKKLPQNDEHVVSTVIIGKIKTWMNFQ